MRRKTLLACPRNIHGIWILYYLVSYCEGQDSINVSVLWDLSTALCDLDRISFISFGIQTSVQ